MRHSCYLLESERSMFSDIYRIVWWLHCGLLVFLGRVGSLLSREVQVHESITILTSASGA